LRTAAKWLGIAIGTVLLLIAALYFGINTELGRRYVAKQIDSLEMASGLDIDIGRSKARSTAS
jgi:translocation and assembly module TamB